ncbi:MAG: cell division protein FtsL [Acidobacteria bacterium]|nr:cell division protein FtsL [Acidobacteriota bacterium]
MEHVEAFEYAIKKDVRNNPIVREVDEGRQRELWMSLGIGVVLVLVVMFDAWQHFELIRHGYRIEQLQKERAAEEAASQHLKLELATLRAPDRVERIAIGRLGMVAPKSGDAIVLERVLPNEPPARSVVASR